MRTSTPSGKASIRGAEWATSLQLECETSGLPLYLRVSRAIAERISDGRLLAGARLPGSRVLANWLGVHRNTVLKAYDELLSEGWLQTSPMRGTYVASTIPLATSIPPRDDSADKVPFALPSAGAAVDVHWDHVHPRTQLFGGTPDLRLLPSVAIARAYRRALRNAPKLLAYGDPKGDVALRREVAKLLRSARGMAIEAEQVLITRGSQMALYLAAASLFNAGDVVVVEALGYPPAWTALKQAGATLKACRVDESGLDTEHLASICERQRQRRQPVRCVYATPHHQYPTTVTLSPSRRLQLRTLALEYGFVVLEDDYDHEFQYEGQPVLPLTSHFPRGHIVYAGTFSKVLAPGLRVGFLVAPEEVLRRATARRFYIDRQGDAATEAALAELLEEGEVQRHIRKTRWVYQERRDACVAQLTTLFGERLQFTVPAGGMALWIESRGPRVERWLEEARRLDVEFQSGRSLFYRPRADSHLRLGFACVTPDEMTEALRRLKTAWQRASRGGTRELNPACGIISPAGIR